MIEGNSIRLRPWAEDDLPFLTELRNNTALQGQLLARVRGSNQGQVRKWLEQRASQDDGLFFVVAKSEDNAPLGFIQISDIDLTDRHANLGICLAKEACGAGRGVQAIKMVCTHLARGWNLRKIMLKVRADNTAALRCYDKAGFKRCGSLTSHVFIDNQWHDIVLMEYFLISKN